MRPVRALIGFLALSLALPGCYLSHELPICVYDVPAEERCLEPPEGVDEGQLAWLGGSFAHRDPRAGCIAVSIDPAMIDHRAMLDDAIARIVTSECGRPCFEPIEIVATGALEPGPRVHLAPDGSCEEVSPRSTGCFLELDRCRGTIELQLLALAVPSEHGTWSTEALAATILLGFGMRNVSFDDARAPLSPRVASLLCAAYEPDEPWCPGT